MNKPITISPTAQKAIDFSSNFATSFANAVPGNVTEKITGAMGIPQYNIQSKAGQAGNVVGNIASNMTQGVALGGVLKPVFGVAQKPLGGVAGKLIAKGGVGNKILGKGVANISQGLPYTASFNLLNKANNPQTKTGGNVLADVGFDFATGMLPIVGVAGMTARKGITSNADSKLVELLKSGRGTYDNLSRQVKVKDGAGNYLNMGTLKKKYASNALDYGKMQPAKLKDTGASYEENKLLEGLADSIQQEGKGRNAQQGYSIGRENLMEANTLGYRDIRGQTANTAEEIAPLLKDFRNPKEEVFHVVYTKGGKVVAHNAMGQNIPDMVGIDPKEVMYGINERADRLGADSVYVAHNHPSGDATPSREDIDIFNKLLDKIGPRLKGELVLDHDKVSIVGKGFPREVDLDLGKSYQATGVSVKNPATLEKLVREHWSPENGKLGLFITNTKAKPVGYENFSITGKSVDQINDTIRQFVRKHRGSNAFGVMNVSTLKNPLGHNIKAVGLSDVLLRNEIEDTYASLRSMGVVGTPGVKKLKLYKNADNPSRMSWLFDQKDNKGEAQKKLKDLMTYQDRLIKEKGISPIDANKIGYKKGMEILNGKTQTGKLQKLEVPQELPKIRAKETPSSLSPTQDLSKIATGESPQQLRLRQLSESPSYEGIIPQSNKEFSEFENMLRSNRTSPKNKANVFDIFRTPEKVLRKMGLGKEMETLRNAWDNYKLEKNTEIDRVTQWYKQAPDPESSKAIFKYLDGQKVNLSDTQKKVADEIKVYLQGWADRLELPHDSRLTNYITHIWEKEAKGVDIDPEFAKLISEKIPGSVYDPFVEKRLGKQGYIEDVWRALDAYVKRATRKVNMDPALEKLKYTSESLDLESYRYIKKYADALNMRPTEAESLVDNAIKSVIGFRATARPVSYLSSRWRNMIYKGALGLNIGSAVRNLTQGVNTYAKLGEKYTILGYIDVARKIGRPEFDELKKVGVLQDSFINDRSYSAVKEFAEKTDKVFFSFFDLAEKINRGSAYFGAKKKALAEGMSEVQAIKYAKQIVRDTQFTFGAIDTPQVLRSDLNKTLLQFQSFNIKQAEFLGEMLKAKDVAGLVRFSAGSAVMLATIGKLIGMDWKENLPFAEFITGEQKIADTPTLQAIGGVHQTIFGDEYEKAKGKDKLAKTAILLLPGGSQAKKTFQGIQAGQQGYSATKSGGARFLVPENRKLQAAVFGQYATPEATEYFNKDRRPLSAKQTELLKQTDDKEAVYNEIMQTRVANAEENKVREAVRESGQAQTVNEKFMYYDSESEQVKSINMNPDLTPPQLTGQKELDKEILSDYKSSLSRRINDIVKLYELGQMSSEEAEKEIAKISVLKEIVSQIGKSSKPKKIRVSRGSIPKTRKTSVKKVSLKTIKRNDKAKFNVKVKKPTTYKVSQADLEKLRTGNV